MVGSVDTIGIKGAKLASKTLSITCIGLNILPISAGIACTLSFGNKVLRRINVNKNKNTTTVSKRSTSY